MLDEIDADCPICKGNVVAGDCRCDGGEQAAAGVERYTEYAERGRARVVERSNVPLVLDCRRG